MLEFHEVSKIYHLNGRDIPALISVSFKVKKGEFVSIIGKSGAGKTTLVKLIVGEEKPTQGEIYFEGENICQMKPKDLRYLRRKIGIVHQDYKLLLSKSVRENLEYVMQVIGAKENEIKRDVPEVLEIVGLQERASSFPDNLSGGEKQRLAIARSLIHRPSLLIADEPTGNLDLFNTLEIINIFKKVNQLGTTIILSTHDKNIVDSLQKRVIALDEGRIIHDLESGRLVL